MIVIDLERNTPNGPVIMIQCMGKDEKMERWHVNSLKSVHPAQTPPAPAQEPPKTPA